MDTPQCDAADVVKASGRRTGRRAIGMSAGRASGQGETPIESASCPTAESSQSHILGVHREGRDIRLVERAVKEGWDIPEEVYTTLPNSMLHIAQHGSSEHVRIGAARVLVAMHGQELEARKPAPQTVNLTQVNLGTAAIDPAKQALLADAHRALSAEPPAE